MSEAELQLRSAEERENIEVLRAELAKPDEERGQPEPDTIRAAVRDQSGLELRAARRSLPILIVEQAR